MSIKGKLAQYGIVLNGDGDLSMRGNLSARNMVKPKGSVWYVDASVTASGHGKTWGKAFKTITEAVAVASNYDTIAVAAGDYDEGAVINITQEGLRIIGSGSQTRQVSLWYTSSASHHIVTINAHNVEISGMAFYQTKNNKDCIRVSTTASYFKAWIHDCWLSGAGTGEYGVHTGTTYDSPDIMVEDCQFKDFATACIYANTTRGIFRNNILLVAASTIGIEHVPNSGDRPDQMYIGNKILGANSSDTGIKITNTPSALTYMILENLIAGCNTTITSKATNDAACILNYTGDASGGALINPSAD